MPTATLVDRWGNAQTVAAANGYYTVSLPVATANLVSNPDDYIVGGDPVILIETDTVSPTSALSPLPAVTKGTAVTLTWTATDGESGIWYTQIQKSAAPDGPWDTIASLSQTRGITQTVYQGQHGETAYFRARARDRVGNWEPWSDGFEVSTTVDADTELHWQLRALFNDNNGNGVWDRGGTGSLQSEITLTQVSMRFLDENWHTIAAVVGSSWYFTETWLPGIYHFSANWQDAQGEVWVASEQLWLDGLSDPLYAPDPPIIGLRRQPKLFFPLMMKQGT